MDTGEISPFPSGRWRGELSRSGSPLGLDLRTSITRSPVIRGTWVSVMVCCSLGFIKFICFRFQFLSGRPSSQEGVELCGCLPYAWAVQWRQVAVHIRPTDGQTNEPDR